MAHSHQATAEDSLLHHDLPLLLLPSLLHIPHLFLLFFIFVFSSLPFLFLSLPHFCPSLSSSFFFFLPVLLSRVLHLLLP